MNTTFTCKHESVACPRCSRSFECRVGSINLCQCQAVTLTSDQRQYIDSLYAGCLCADCLLALRTDYNRLQYEQTLTKILNE